MAQNKRSPSVKLPISLISFSLFLFCYTFLQQSDVSYGQSIPLVSMNGNNRPNYQGMQGPPPSPLFTMLGNLLGGIGSSISNSMRQPSPSNSNEGVQGSGFNPRPSFPFFGQGNPNNRPGMSGQLQQPSPGSNIPGQPFPGSSGFRPFRDPSIKASEIGIPCSGPTPSSGSSSGSTSGKLHDHEDEASDQHSSGRHQHHLERNVNRTGTCVTSPFECKNAGGQVLGPCLRYRGPNTVPVPYGACCYHEVTCGQQVVVNGTHFRSPHFPNPHSNPGSCQVAVKNTYPNVCQIRLDFVVFNLRQPTAGDCLQDRFVINGQESNSITPSLCGFNPGQHIYIEVGENNDRTHMYSGDRPSSLTNLNVITSGIRDRWFDIRVHYIPCDSPTKAPKHCLQYHFGLIGQLMSFNYDLFNQGFTYFNNMDYAICFRKSPGFCSVSFSVPQEEDEKGHSPQDTFPDVNDNFLPFKRPELRPPHEVTSFHVVGNESHYRTGILSGCGPFLCPTDYVIIESERYCGYHLNSNIWDGSKVDETITDSSNGPAILRFVSSSDSVGKGFILNFQMNPCLMNGK